MTELQRVELDILKVFIQVCEKLNLTYYLVCGSALGAVKYGGFIPWDDDIDVGLLREDYEIFCEKAQDLLPEYIFLQNHRTEPEFPLLMTKLRDSRTTFIEPLLRKLDINHGVYIDVFPIDGYPHKLEEIELIEKEKKRCDRHRMVKYAYNRFSFKNIIHLKAILYYLLYKVFGCWRNTHKVIERFEKIATSYSCKESTLWCNHGNWQGKLEYAVKEQYGNGIIVSFEGIDVRVPELYDDYLTQKYGDWKSDLPEEKKSAPHNPYKIDLNQSYLYYMKSNKVSHFML